MSSDALYDVTIVKFGTRAALKSEVYLNYKIYHRPDDEIGMDYFFWIIRNADRTVLVDTGFSKLGGESRNRSFLIDVADAYAHAGVDTAGSHDLIVTHAHYDHIGNLSLFPNARVLISEAEYGFWTSTLGTRAQFAYSVDADGIDYLKEVEEQGRLSHFSGTHQIAPGIEVIEIGGHTPGQSVVKVATSEGTVLLASDAIHYYEEYETDIPFAFVADLPAMYRGFDTIRAMVADDVTHLVSGHDPDTLNRFTPVTSGPLAGLAATIGTPASSPHAR